jgi:5'-3' exonuclease
VTPPRIRELLREHREAAFQSRDLARIVTDLPIEVDFEHCRYGALSEEQRETALSTVRLFEFKSMTARYASTQDGAQRQRKHAHHGDLRVARRRILC